jgi:threonine/homoserine/homoserine lactone efflux protein
LLCLVAIAVFIVVAAIALLAVTTRVVVLVGALLLLFLALAAVIAEVLRLASDDAPAKGRRRPRPWLPSSSSPGSPSADTPTIGPRR